MSMISLMIAMSLSCAVLLTSVSLLHIARDNFQHHHQTALLEDSAAFAIEIISRTLQQAVDTDSLASMASPSENSTFKVVNGEVQGLDNARMSSDTASIGAPIVAAMNGNDVLAVNLSPVDGDTVNCAGFVVPETAVLSPESGWVFFHIVVGSDGEPSLHCRYRGQKTWDSQAILSGVECFQVLYGLDTDGDNLPNQFLSASAIAGKDKAKPASDPSFWRSVVAVHIALILRSAEKGAEPSIFKGIALFGEDYASAREDPGTRIGPGDLAPSVRTRARRHVEAIIFLHKPEQIS
jgi:type IV pilus assembly protein PilW